MRKKVFSADNQQGSEHIKDYVFHPSETTRQAPLSKIEIQTYFLGALHDGTFSSNRRFRISQTKLEKLKKLLNDLRIETGKIHNPSEKVDPDYWRMYILASSQKTFIEKIGSWHPRKIRTLRKRMMI